MQKAVSIKLDRNINQTDWNLYLKKYKKQYRCYIDEIGIWSIKCQYGFVQPFSIVNNELLAVLTYKSARGINNLLKSLQSEAAPAFRIVQRGDSEVSLCFSEKNIIQFAKLLRFGHVRKISEQQRKILAEQLKKARLARSNNQKYVEERKKQGM